VNASRPTQLSVTHHDLFPAQAIADLVKAVRCKAIWVGHFTLSLISVPVPTPCPSKLMCR